MMKDMGSLHYCLGVSIIQNVDGIWLHQKQYVLSLLRRFGLTDAKPISTPADLNVKLVKDDGWCQQRDDRQSIVSIYGGEFALCCYGH